MALLISKNLLIALLCIQIGSLVVATVAKPAKSGNVEAMITKKLKSATPAQINKYKMNAAKRLQTDLVPAMQALSTNQDVPANVQASSKAVLQGLKSGKLTTPLSKSMPTILQKASIQQGKPAEQLQTILGSALGNAPVDLKNPLQGTITFLSTNLNGVNAILGKTLGGVPDLLSGTVKSLTGTLGAVTDSTIGTLGSLGPLIGGLMSGN